ncbi:cytochrome P450 [Paraconexibacter algicola]|uniref:Cytochrome P450 n=2 Tax=Paraconexibacter algicola TaxID=2133960 RepID=A0A2T4UN60_9ACTN|nr:cytochrome P450 [Paraconexibacter algicola]
MPTAAGSTSSPTLVIASRSFGTRIRRSGSGPIGRRGISWGIAAAPYRVGMPTVTARPVLPPGPTVAPVRQSLAWIARPMAFMERCRAAHGDVFTARIFGDQPLVFVADPGLVRDVLTGDPDVLRAGEGNAILRPVVGSRSLLLLDGADHLAQRRMMLPAFHGDRIDAYVGLMRTATAREVDGWHDGPVAAWPRMQAITLEIVVAAVFGVTEPTRAARLRDVLARMLDDLAAPTKLVRLALATRGARRGESDAALEPFRRATRGVHALLQEELDRRRGADGGQDVLSLLLAARDETGRGLTDEEVRDQLITLLVAGHETTATTLAWALERLVRHPAALHRAVQEADDGGHAWLDAVVRETLRLRPVLPIVVRHTTAPVRLGDHLLPAGIDVAPCIHLLHRRPDAWPDPHAFRPERFLDDGGRDAYTWLPFGGGVRRCLGASFALVEARVVLAELLRRVTVHAVRERPERVARRAITLTPSRSATIGVTRRI